MNNFIASFPAFTLEHYIVATVGVGYAIVGILRLLKGDVGNAIVWVGYAFSNIGLIMLMK